MRETPSDHEDRIRALEDSGGGGVTDHGALTGLADDDHPQYSQTTHNHDADYSDIAHTHTLAYGARTTATITTASLAVNATEDSTVTLAAGYRLLGFDSDRACRVRLYTTSAARTADAARAIGTDVDIATDHGLVFEYVATAAADVDLSPLVDGMCPTGTTVYYAIENRSGGTSAVQIILDYIRTE